MRNRDGGDREGELDYTPTSRGEPCRDLEKFSNHVSWVYFLNLFLHFFMSGRNK